MNYMAKVHAVNSLAPLDSKRSLLSALLMNLFMDLLYIYYFLCKDKN